MSDHIAKADECMQKAEKKLKGWGLFGNKYEEAQELLEKAANNYKLGKAWTDATAAFDKLADVHIKQESKHEAASSYVEAAKCMMKVKPSEAAKYLERAVSIYTDMGRLNMAARQLKELAEVQEKQGLKEEAIAFYTQAADLFATENSTSDANKCRLKIAEMSAEVERYDRSVELYEEVARASVENNLLKYSAKGYLLQAGVCVLCYGSDEMIANKIELYKDIDINFNGSRECNLLETLAEALCKADEKMFATAVAEFDSMTRLDAWKTAMLLKVKRRVGARQAGEEAPEEEDDELL
jgi:alpha-soluble NSF attachment protein